MTLHLHPRQKELLDLIERSITERGYAPVVRELIRDSSIPTASMINHHLDVLIEAGYIERDPGARAIRLLRGSDGQRRELRLVRVDDDGHDL